MALAAVGQMVERQRRHYRIVGLRRRGCGEIRTHEFHALAQRLQALARDQQHLGSDVEEGQPRFWEGLGDHRGQEAAAGAEIEHLEAISGCERQQFERGAIKIVEARHQFAPRPIVIVAAGRDRFASRLSHLA